MREGFIARCVQALRVRTLSRSTNHDIRGHTPVEHRNDNADSSVEIIAGFIDDHHIEPHCSCGNDVSPPAGIIGIFSPIIDSTMPDESFGQRERSFLRLAYRRTPLLDVDQPPYFRLRPIDLVRPGNAANQREVDLVHDLDGNLVRYGSSIQ